jgi:hypothetical protein
MTEKNPQRARKKCDRSIKRFVINPSVQWRYTGTAVAGVFVVSALVSVLLYGVLFDQARSRSLFLSTTTATDVTVSIITAAVAFATVPAIACGLWAIVMTHRLCGPIRVMETHLRELAAGRFPKHRPLRKKDNFRDVYGLFWRAVDTVKDSELKQFEAIRRLRDSAHEAVAGNEDADQLVARMTARLDELCQEASARLGVGDVQGHDRGVMDLKSDAQQQTPELVGTMS